MASDPRVGSARDNGTSPGLSRLAQGSNSSSITSLLATIIPVSIYAVVCVIIFVILRRKCHRVYAPRTLLSSLRQEYDHHLLHESSALIANGCESERTPTLPGGWFNWIKPFYKIPDTHVLNHSSIDGYLFLRYLRILGVICLVGVLLIWPILLPIHATGGNGNTELDMFSMGNVTDARFYYAHAALAWLYFGFILYMISRECVYYVNLRQAYLSSPQFSTRLSSRTVLFTNIPQRYLEEARLRKLFGDSARKIWVARYSKELNKLIRERKQTAQRLEDAEVHLIKMANFAKARAEHKRVTSKQNVWQRFQRKRLKTSNTDRSPDPESLPSTATDESAIVEKDECKIDTSCPLPDVNGSVAGQWISYSARPHHRPIANYGRRVDTIKWTRQRLKKLGMQIRKLRRDLLLDPSSVLPAAFIEFDTQEEAQIAYQTLPHHRPFQMSPRFIGVRPYEIIWDSLSMQWKELMLRRFAVRGFVAVLIIFWAIPCALVGTISNIQYLAAKVPFLFWLADLPKGLLGLIQGLLPAVALTWLMSLVPGIMRFCAIAAGAPTLAMVELFSQSTYFIFQVVQVFLVTTLTSAVSASLTSVLKNPPSATTLLSQNLPKASNFYLSYFFVQCMALGASSLIHLLDLFKFQFLQSRTPSASRMYDRWHKLQRIHWGGVFPVFTNLGVIAITYACIAPIVLGFALIGVVFVHTAYRYNVLFVYDSEIDTQGLVYPKALLQTLTGVYLSVICLIGLFAIRGAFGPIVMGVGLLIFTCLVHISIKDTLAPLLANLPRTLAAENKNEDWIGHNINTAQNEEHRLSFDHFDFLEDRDVQGPEEEEVVHVPGSARIEGAEGAVDTLATEMRPKLKKKLNGYFPIDQTFTLLDKISRMVGPDPNRKPNFIKKWLYPQTYCDYSILRHMIPPESQAPEYEEEMEKMVYYPPTFAMRAPRLWIPRDDAGVSRQEVAHTGKVIRITDEGARLDERGRIVLDYSIADQEIRRDTLLEQWRF